MRDADGNFYMPTREQLSDTSYEVKQVVWKVDWGAYLPFCPHCDEPAYNDDICFNCGKKYEMTEGEHKNIEVSDGDWKAVQTPGMSLYIVRDGEIIVHASCTSMFTEEELRQQLKRYKEKK